MRNTVFSRLRPSSPRHPAGATLLAALVLAPALLVGCSSTPTMPTMRELITAVMPYEADVVQGNVVTAEQLAGIKPGLQRTQVRDVLGTPLVADPFHAQRWDYVFTFKRQGADLIQRSMTVEFDKDKDVVTKVTAPDMPAERDFVASISRSPLPTSSPKLELTEAERAALPAPRGVAAPVVTGALPQGATRKYPPLEP